MKTEPFNPENPKHLKGFENTVKKLLKKRPKISGVILPKDIYKKLKKIGGNGFLKN
ncbi:MAG: hypothetical protein L6Q29_03510 [Candidatus Pacebacteria bacterium]|nr:hypothetical protein [Candidatus Paceibacterota bacterium]NUQ57524.1 hypothetical protein [Candidatus Paceibacter sp.]